MDSENDASKQLTENPGCSSSIYVYLYASVMILFVWVRFGTSGAQCLQPAGLSISVKVMQYQCFLRSISETVDQYNIILQCTSMFDVTLLTVCYQE